MKKIALFSLLILASNLFAAEDKEGWISLFDGKSLEGWKANENSQTFKVEDGKIVVFGPRSHLFYVGPVQNHNFKNFELKLDIMTFPKANSGVYFHTEWLDVGFPRKGHEVQVNTTHTDPKRTAGLYGVKDNYDALVKDEQWFTMHITVQGKHVTTKVNGKTIVDYTEPEGAAGGKPNAARRISSGTFALQGHDPGSKIYYKNILVKPLPEK
ncbi:MAG: DUF1080 domain-containing protein [Verrucomicrobia bacterium]|nr:DUF1080 domain-containing protein [Verrucomicrobiota bacterium]